MIDGEGDNEVEGVVDDEGLWDGEREVDTVGDGVNGIEVVGKGEEMGEGDAIHAGILPVWIVLLLACQK